MEIKLIPDTDTDQFNHPLLISGTVLPLDDEWQWWWRADGYYSIISALCGRLSAQNLDETEYMWEFSQLCARMWAHAVCCYFPVAPVAGAGWDLDVIVSISALCCLLDVVSVSANCWGNPPPSEEDGDSRCAQTES